MNANHRIRVAFLANKLQKDILFANRIGVNVVNIKGKPKSDTSTTVGGQYEKGF